MKKNNLIAIMFGFFICVTAFPSPALHAANIPLYDRNRNSREEKKKQQADRQARKTKQDENVFWSSKSLNSKEEPKSEHEGS